MDIRTVHLLFQYNGRELHMGSSTALPICDIKGLEATDYEIALSPNASGVGSTAIGGRIAERTIAVEFDLPSNSDFNIYRQEVIAFFVPRMQGNLIVDYNGLRRNIPYCVTEFKFANSNLYENLRGQLTIICPQPLFLNMDSYGKNIAAKTPLLAFPLVIPRGSGRAMSYKTLKQNVSLPNDGHVDTGVIMIFKAVRGTVKNPKMEKVSTGQYMQAVLEMNQGQELKIDTNSGHKVMELNGKNVMHTIERGSSFFAITPGDNILKYSAEENYTNLDVTLYYTPKYLGV